MTNAQYTQATPAFNDHWSLLAQTSAPGVESGAATQPSAAAASSDETTGADSSNYHLAWKKWLTIHGWQEPLQAVSILLLTLLLGLTLLRIFRKFLDRYQISRSLGWGIFAIAVYSALNALHPGRMWDNYDILALIVHRAFIAVMLFVGLRLFDRVIIIPVLTRGGKVVLSRFIHQIIVAVITLFVGAQYVHWAFGLDISSLLTGTAVISIVLGLALQETLGNFFSGLVLQASVPFQPGDWIKIGDIEGRVVEMTWRTVTLLTGDGNYVLLPNSTVSKERITNYHTPTKATAYSISVALENDVPPHVARRVLIQAISDSPEILGNPAPAVIAASFDASTITYKLIFWIDDPQRHGAVESAVRDNTWYRIRQGGLNIPYNVAAVSVTDMQNKQKGVAAANEADRYAAISKCPLFAPLSDELKAKLAAKTVDFHLAPGQAFFRQDDVADSMFILMAGTVDVFIRTEDGREVDVGDIQAGETFGEVSALTGHARTVTIKAKTPVRALEITRAHLHDLFAQDSNLMSHISAAVAKRQAEREDAYQKAGAGRSDHGQHTQSQTVLDRMRGFFNMLHR